MFRLTEQDKFGRETLQRENSLELFIALCKLFRIIFKENEGFKPHTDRRIHEEKRVAKKVFKGPFLASFSIFSSFHLIQLTETNVLFKSLTMTGFKLRIFGVGSDHSTN